MKENEKIDKYLKITKELRKHEDPIYQTPPLGQDMTQGQIF